MISVIIPCLDKHVYLLPELFVAYENQTVRPDELIVVVSGDFNTSEISCLNTTIPLIVSVSKQRLYAGAARQRGVDISNGEIIIFNDADDIPHRQRVEITHYFFNKFNTVHLNGLWKSGDFKFTYNIPRIPFILAEEIIERSILNYKPYGGWLAANVHAGNVAVSREVFDKVAWTNSQKGQDMVFCLDLLHTFNRSIIVLANLIRYRIELSSWGVV